MKNQEQNFECGNCGKGSPESEWKKATREYGHLWDISTLRASLETILGTDRPIVCPNCTNPLDGLHIQKARNI